MMDTAASAPLSPPAPLVGRAQLWGLRAALVVLVWAAYYPVWENDLVDFDDEVFITKNEHVCDGLTGDGISWALRNDEPPYRMPLTWLTLQFDVELSARIAPGSAVPLPQIVHAHNLVWHTINVVLLFGLSLRLPGATRGRAFLVAALYAVHPMHVESVAWGIERKDVLMCAFGLVCVRAYLRFAETGRWPFYAVAFVALALSLAAKPMLLTMPFVLLLLDYWPLGRTRRTPRRCGARGELFAPRFGESAVLRTRFCGRVGNHTDAFGPQARRHHHIPPLYECGWRVTAGTCPRPCGRPRWRCCTRTRTTTGRGGRV